MNNLDLYCVTNKKLEFLEYTDLKLAAVGKDKFSNRYLRCEVQFGFNELKGYDTLRLYAYLAERYLSFWFKKYTNYKEEPWISLDL